MRKFTVYLVALLLLITCTACGEGEWLDPTDETSSTSSSSEAPISAPESNDPQSTPASSVAGGAVTDIVIEGASIMEKGSSQQLTAKVYPENAANTKVVWSVTEGGTYAMIDSTGALLAFAKGTVTVCAKATDGSEVAAYFKVTVTEKPSDKKIPVESLLILGAQRMQVGAEQTLVVAVTPYEATDRGVTWSILSGADVVRMEEKSVIVAVAKGTATIQVVAKDGSGVRATFTVEVVD